MSKPSEKKHNPFSHNRVDTPFQTHIDFQEVYQDEFNRLQSIIEDIQRDELNHQSKGAVVIGEPGMGKTHLMMRLAKERLASNRLLFIRQPNNLNSVLYHIYSRVLESFVEKVPGSEYSQLEHLLANSFTHIIRQMSQANRGGILASFKPANKDKYILQIVSEQPLNLYQKLGNEGSKNKRDYWQRIENMVTAWWKKNYSEGGYSTAFIQGIIKYCSYSDPNKKKLVGKWLAANELEADELRSIGLNNWHDALNQEAFSLQAMSVFGNLSILDDPLILIFDQLEALGEGYNEDLLRSFGEAIKEIFTHVPNSLIILNLFPQRWEHFQTIFDGAVLDRVSQDKMVLTIPEPGKLKEILALNAQSQGIDIDEFFTSEELADILNQKTIRNVLVRASDHYKHKVSGIYLPKRSTPKAATYEAIIAQKLQALDDKISAKDWLPKALAEQIRALDDKISAKDWLPKALAEQIRALDDKISAKDWQPKALAEQLQALDDKISAKGWLPKALAEQIRSLDDKISAKDWQLPKALAEQLKALDDKISAKDWQQPKALAEQLQALDDKISAKDWQQPKALTEQLKALDDIAKGWQPETLAKQLKALDDIANGLKPETLAKQFQVLEEQIIANGLKPEILTKQLQVLEEQIIANGLKPEILAKQLQALEEQIIANGLKPEILAKQLQALEEQIIANGLKPETLAKQLQALEEQIAARPFEQKITKELQTIRQEIVRLKILLEEVVAIALKPQYPQKKTLTELNAEVGKLLDSKPTITAPLEEPEEREEREEKEELASMIEDYLEDKISLLAYQYDNAIITVTDSDDIGKLETVLNAFKTIKAITLSAPILLGKKLTDYILLTTPTKLVIVSFINADGNTFTNKLKKCNELLANYQKIQYFVLFRDQRQTSFDKKGGVGREELQKFRRFKKSSATIMDKNNRIKFELAYQLITDILNKDEEFHLEEALHTLESYLSEEYWLVRLMK